MLRYLFVLVLIVFSLPPALRAQDRFAVLKELLEMPSPRPRLAPEDDKPRKSYADAPLPPDDAPIEDLLGYWKEKADGFYPGRQKPPVASVKSAIRIIEAAGTDRTGFDVLLKILPDDPAVAQKVKGLFDSGSEADRAGHTWEKIKDWLKFNSTYYTDELLAAARKVKDSAKYGSIEKDEELKALARLDWEKAAPVLEKLQDDKAGQRTAALAVSLLYEHALAGKNEADIEEYRTRLKALVEDKDNKATTRDIAMDALASSDWPGRDDWYLSLFSDETLLRGVDEHTGYNTLMTIAEKDPDKWIPILAGRVGSKDRAVHNAAVGGLMEFEKRKDALLPLLPWLSDPNWAEGDDRYKLIQFVGELDMPESVPGLIWILENDSEDYAHWAARSLAAFKDPRAAPALRGSIEGANREGDREEIIEALIACGGLTEAEMIAAVDIYAKAALQPGGYEKVETRDDYEYEDPLPVDVSIGRFIAGREKPDEIFARQFFEHIKDVENTDAGLAKKLREIAAKWKGRAIYAEMLQLVAENKAGAADIITILARRKEIRGQAPLELTWLAGKSGAARALEAGISENELRMSEITTGADIEGRIAALAVARLIRLKLPIAGVIPFLKDNNKLLALAAERYLESEDSPEARRAVLAAHPGEMLILGARESFGERQVNAERGSPLYELFRSCHAYLSGRVYGEMDKFENKLRAEMKENPHLSEVYARIFESSSGQLVVRIYKDRATVTFYSDKAFYRQKTLTKAELREFREMITPEKLDNFVPRTSPCHYDCSTREVVRLDRTGGRRIFSDMGMSALGGLDFLYANFSDGEFKLHYYLQNKIKGLEVLLADDDLGARAIWKTGDGDLRVLIADKEKEREIWRQESEMDDLDRKNEEMDDDVKTARRQQRHDQRAYEHFSWRVFKDGQLGKQVDEPADVPYLRDRIAFPDVEHFGRNDSTWQARSGDHEIRGGNGMGDGLARVNRWETIKIRDGWYNHPVTTPDGKWAVVSKTDTNWDRPHSLYRVDLRTGEEYQIGVKPSKGIEAVAFLPVHNKMLIDGADQGHYLLDVETGKLEEVKGEFQPLKGQTYRALQPTGRPNEFWAAILDSEKNETEVGTYDVKNFTFKAILKLPAILLGSMDIWVDENGGKVYFVYRGDGWRGPHLLSVPLLQQQKTDLPRSPARNEFATVIYKMFD